MVSALVIAAIIFVVLVIVGVILYFVLRGSGGNSNGDNTGGNTGQPGVCPGNIIPIGVPGNQALTCTDIANLCTSRGLTVATPEQLQGAISNGFTNCKPGYASDCTAYQPVANLQSNCPASIGPNPTNTAFPCGPGTQSFCHDQVFCYRT